jgi:hypothetical protein
MFIRVLSDSVAIVAYDDKSTADQVNPVAVDESAFKKYPLVPTVSLPTVSAAVPTRMSPLASKIVSSIAEASSNDVKVIISRMSPAVKAAREVMLVPLDAV